MGKKNVLVVAAHPDDEILGCGATVAKLKEEGYDIYTLILGEGVTSRDDKRDRDANIEQINHLKSEINDANNIVGVSEVFTSDFPDNRFDTVAFLDIVKEVERIKSQVQPSIIFTHFQHDLNVDHQITAKAVLTATRPMEGECVKEIYAFEVLSSTEWNFPTRFSPNYFVDTSKTLDLKVKAMDVYKSELREYPHPRSLKGIELLSQQWGMKVGVKYAEAFEVVRVIN